MILECLKLAAAEGVQQELEYSNLLLKAFKCVGKGTECFCSHSADNRDTGSSPPHLARLPLSSLPLQRLPQSKMQNPSRASPSVAKTLHPGFSEGDQGPESGPCVTSQAAWRFTDMPEVLDFSLHGGEGRAPYPPPAGAGHDTLLTPRPPPSLCTLT